MMKGAYEERRKAKLFPFKAADFKILNVKF